jgi:GDP-L-fucose synthase
MEISSKILILGSRGMVGSALVRELKALKFENLLVPTRDELDLLNQKETIDYFLSQKPDFVFNAAAKVGGILVNNTCRADFIFENLTIQNNIFEGCFKSKVTKLLFLGSSCIYPRECPQPMKEEHLLSGPLEPTNEPFAIAKIAGVKMAESFRNQYGCKYFSVLPTSLYGINDNYYSESGHVVAGLIARMIKAKESGKKEVEIWGTGNPKREFLFVDDMAKACIHVMNYEGSDLPDFLNIGTGSDISIADLARVIASEVGYTGELVFDKSKPDGTMRKLLDVSKINSLGWFPETSLEEGIKKSVAFFKNNR